MINEKKLKTLLKDIINWAYDTSPDFMYDKLKDLEEVFKENK